MTPPLRILLVDDERPARERLRALLRGVEDVEVVGEAEDGEQAIERISDLAPDVVLMDIQMPECSGLEVAASLSAPRPRIVFCTAFDQHAVDAFELNAVDYLLKPVSRARLAQALDRARARSGGDRVPALPGTYPQRFLGKRGVRFHVIPAREVLYFASEEGLTRVHVKSAHFWMQPTLADLEAQLDPAAWFRVSRAAILHLEAVVEVRPHEGGHGEAKLTDGTVVPVSRRRLAALLARLGTAGRA